MMACAIIGLLAFVIGVLAGGAGAALVIGTTPDRHEPQDGD
jgi:hypothetical protein